MDEFKSKISSFLKEKDIYNDYSQEIETLYSNNQLNENMPFNACQTVFLLQMSKSNKMFENILKKKYLFDLKCRIECSKLSNDYTSEKIQLLLQKNFKNRLEYAHVEKDSNEYKICLKFNDEIYSTLKNAEVEEFLIPYKLLVFDEKLKISDFLISDILFSPETPKAPQKAYAEFIEHLKSLKIPLRIISDFLLFENTNILSTYFVDIYLPETSQWPKEQSAIDCAKTAFYCQLFLKSQYRLAISKEYCVFKYKGFQFIVKILLKSDFNVKYKILQQLHSIIKQKGHLVQRKAIFLKTLLARMGLYPLVFDDFIVDIIILMIDKDYVGDSRFLEEVLNFNFKLENVVFDLETLKVYSNTNPGNTKTLKITYKELSYNLALPAFEYFEDIQKKIRSLKPESKLFLNDDLILETDSKLAKDLEKYDFVLSKTKKENMREIVGIIDHQFDLGFADPKEFTRGFLSQFANFAYDPFDHLLMVKSKSGIDIDLLKNLVVNETSFDYIS